MYAALLRIYVQPAAKRARGNGSNLVEVIAIHPWMASKVGSKLVLWTENTKYGALARDDRDLERLETQERQQKQQQQRGLWASGVYCTSSSSSSSSSPSPFDQLHYCPFWCVCMEHKDFRACTKQTCVGWVALSSSSQTRHYNGRLHRCCYHSSHCDTVYTLHSITDSTKFGLGACKIVTSYITVTPKSSFLPPFRSLPSPSQLNRHASIGHSLHSLPTAARCYQSCVRFVAQSAAFLQSRGWTLDFILPPHRHHHQRLAYMQHFVIRSVSTSTYFPRSPARLRQGYPSLLMLRSEACFRNPFRPTLSAKCVDQ